MNATDVQQNIENLKAEISDLLFFMVTLDREIELIQPGIESKIVKPTRTININNLSEKDLEVDLVPIKLANMELVQLRKQFHYAKLERANTIIAIEAKKQMLRTYVEQVRQDMAEGTQSIKEDTIYDLFRKVQNIKDLTPEETITFDEIKKNLLQKINAGRESRKLLFDTLSNIIKLHS